MNVKLQGWIDLGNGIGARVDSNGKIEVSMSWGQLTATTIALREAMANGLGGTIVPQIEESLNKFNRELSINQRLLEGDRDESNR